MDIEYWQKRCELAEDLIRTEHDISCTRIEARQALLEWENYKALETQELGSVLNLRVDKLPPGRYKLSLCHGATNYPVCEFDINVNQDEMIGRKVSPKTR